MQAASWNSLVSDTIRLFKAWYDHPYAILEDEEDGEGDVRIYAGGKTQNS